MLRHVVITVGMLVATFQAVYAQSPVPVYHTFEKCVEVAEQRLDGHCHITALELGQAQKVLQLFADTDPTTTAKYERARSVVRRAGDVWGSMSGLAAGKDKSTVVPVCVGYSKSHHTVFVNCSK